MCLTFLQQREVVCILGYLLCLCPLFPYLQYMLFCVSKHHSLYDLELAFQLTRHLHLRWPSAKWSIIVTKEKASKKTFPRSFWSFKCSITFFFCNFFFKIECAFGFGEQTYAWRLYLLSAFRCKNGRNRPITPTDPSNDFDRVRCNAWECNSKVGNEELNGELGLIPTPLGEVAVTSKSSVNW